MGERVPAKGRFRFRGRRNSGERRQGCARRSPVLLVGTRSVKVLCRLQALGENTDRHERLVFVFVVALFVAVLVCMRSPAAPALLLPPAPPSKFRFFETSAESVLGAELLLLLLSGCLSPELEAHAPAVYGALLEEATGCDGRGSRFGSAADGEVG